jgi:hypothetical protein
MTSATKQEADPLNASGSCKKKMTEQMQEQQE